MEVGISAIAGRVSCAANNVFFPHNRISRSSEWSYKLMLNKAFKIIKSLRKTPKAFFLSIQLLTFVCKYRENINSIITLVFLIML